MHCRRRKFGDIGRSNLAEHARISPEGSASEQGQYDSDYRTFNRSYDRGCTTKPYPQLPPLPHRKGDIFIEAGRLATEYLVSHGMLPPDVLLNRKNVNNGDFRGHDRDYFPLPSEGRTSPLARPGNAPDSGSRRRFNDDYGSRHHIKGRRRSESAKGYGSDWGRNGSLSEKLKGFSSSMEGEEHKGGQHEERSRTADRGIASEKVVTDELPSKNATAGDSEPRLDTSEFPDNDDSSWKSPSADEDIVEAEKDAKKAIDDAQSTNLDPDEVENNACVEEKQHRNSDENAFSDDVTMQDRTVELDKNTHVVKDSLDRPYNDLLNFCTFAKVPTRARSSLASKVTKRDDKSCREEESKLVTALLDNKELTNSEENVESSLSVFTKQAFGLSGSSSGAGGNLLLQSVEGPGELDSVYVLEKQRCARSQSFPDRSSFVQDEHDGQSPPGFARSRLSELPGVEDRLVQHIVCGDNRGIKRPRELDSQADGMFGPLASKVKSSFDNVPGDDEMVDAIDHASQVNGPMIQDSKIEQIVEMKEAKQLLPDSFKICDLNFSEASVSESPKNVVPNFESVGPSSLRSQDEARVDVGLSIGNNFNGNDASNGSAILSSQKEIIVVDVDDDDDDDLVIGDTVFNNTEKRTDTVYSNLENFLSHTENNVEIPDVHDGYGLVSELLVNDVSNCSPVPTAINDLHNQGVIPGDDDDQIYLSLGEIPLSFVGMWDQPNQEYGKPF